MKETANREPGIADLKDEEKETANREPRAAKRKKDGGDVAERGTRITKRKGAGKDAVPYPPVDAPPPLFAASASLASSVPPDPRFEAGDSAFPSSGPQPGDSDAALPSSLSSGFFDPRFATRDPGPSFSASSVPPPSSDPRPAVRDQRSSPASPPPSGPQSAALDPRLPLSVYMITYNNGPTIERALKSVAGWADEVVVVDSESTDGAIDTIGRYTDRLYQFVTTSQRDKYQRAQDYCTNDWVLFIDADEWLTTEIKMEVEHVLAEGTEFDGFMVNRKNFYLGRVIEHGGWYPDHEIRLYRKDRGFWEGGIHAKVNVNGKVGTLKSFYMHTPYADIAHQIRTVDRYSGAFAEDLASSGRSFHLYNLIGRPLFRFFRDYLFKGGFRDGVPGLIIAASTMYYVFMKHARLWELERKNGRIQR